MNRTLCPPLVEMRPIGHGSLPIQAPHGIRIHTSGGPSVPPVLWGSHFPRHPQPNAPPPELWTSCCFTVAAAWGAGFHKRPLPLFRCVIIRLVSSFLQAESRRTTANERLAREECYYSCWECFITHLGIVLIEMLPDGYVQWSIICCVV